VVLLISWDQVWIQDGMAPKSQFASGTPINGILFTVTVRNSTYASSGRPAI
jgi:hypothetical protein